MKANLFLTPLAQPSPDTGASYSIPADAVVWISNSSEVAYENNELRDLGTHAGKTVVIE